MNKLFYLALISTLLPAMSIAGVSNNVVPVDIREGAKKNGCEQIFDYYDEWRMIDKPYVYGVKGMITGKRTQRDFTYLAWCQKPQNFDNPNRYVLIADLGITQWPGGCKFPITGFEIPGGLRIKNLNNASLALYSSRSGVKAVGAKFSGPVIESDRDGLGYEIVCHEGNWLIHTFD